MKVTDDTLTVMAANKYILIYDLFQYDHNDKENLRQKDCLHLKNNSH